MVALLGVSPAPAVAAPNIDGAMKVELLQALSAPPKIVWFGSSTTREVDPLQVQRLTGRRTFNAGVSAGRPTQHRALALLLEQRFAGRYPHLVVGLDLEQFRREHDRVIRPRPAGSAPSARSVYRADGYRHANIYAGRPSGLQASIEHYRSRVYPGLQRLQPSQLGAFDAFLAIANRNGDAPTIVLYPVHPRFGSAMRPVGRLKRLRELRVWLHDTAARGRRFSVVDMTSLRVYGGVPGEFHDGVHQRPANVRRMVKAIVRSATFNPPPPAPLPPPPPPAAG